MNDRGRFDGQVALVTGGGRGIGRAIALALVAEGAAVAVFSRTTQQLESVVREIEQGGGRAIQVAGDVREVTAVEQAVEQTCATFGCVDVLINCAGVFHLGPSEVGSLEDWQTIIDTNLTGTYLFCQAVGRHMLAAGRGKIVNFGSLLSFVAFPERAAYAASKGGVLQLTRVLGVEWIKRGVNVNAVCPGMIKVETPHQLIARRELREEQFKARIPAGRVGAPRDVVGPTLFLASSDADYVAGQTVVVDGGWLAYGYL